MRCAVGVAAACGVETRLCVLQCPCGAEWMLLEFLFKVSTQKWAPRTTVRTGRTFIRRWSTGECHSLSGNLQRPASFVVGAIVVWGKGFSSLGSISVPTGCLTCSLWWFHLLLRFRLNAHRYRRLWERRTQNTKCKVNTFLFLVTTLSCKRGPAEV